jgi:hypothetical protein
MADSSRHNLSYVQESTYGVTPTSNPTFTDLRHTSVTLGLTKGAKTSDELNPDRQIRDHRHGIRSVSGDVGFELSYESFDDMLEAMAQGTWTADVLKAGTTRRSFSVLRHFSDIADGAAKPYQLFTGCEVNSFNLTVNAEDPVTGTFSLLGKDLSPLQNLTAFGTPTFSSPTTTEMFDGFTGFVKENGVTIATVTEITLSWDNGLEPRYSVFSDSTSQHGNGRSNLTGSIGAYFDDSSLIEKFLDETVSSLEFELEDPAGNKYTFLVPKIKYTGGQADATGQSNIQTNLPFQAIFDSTEATNIKITRTDA